MINEVTERQVSHPRSCSSEEEEPGVGLRAWGPEPMLSATLSLT